MGWKAAASDGMEQSGATSSPPTIKSRVPRRKSDPTAGPGVSALNPSGFITPRSARTPQQQWGDGSSHPKDFLTSVRLLLDVLHP